MKDSGYLNKYEKNLNKKLNLFQNNSTEGQKISNNEKLLDALDNMDENLADDNLNFSFTRISLLDYADRNSIIHGTSFKNNRDFTDRVSLKRLSRRMSRSNSNNEYDLMNDDIDDQLLPVDWFEKTPTSFDLNLPPSNSTNKAFIPRLAVFTIEEAENSDMEEEY